MFLECFRKIKRIIIPGPGGDFCNGELDVYKRQEFKNIDKFYGDNHVLKGINLEINKGDFVTLLGPSGCGKSTLLRCLAGLEQISGGQILLDGEDITNKDPKDRNIGMVFQQYSLFPNMTVEENLSFGLKLQKLDTSEINRRVKDAIDMVELKGKEKEYPANLSGGQQQRVALARGCLLYTSFQLQRFGTGERICHRDYYISKLRRRYLCGRERLCCVGSGTE